MTLSNGQQLAFEQLQEIVDASRGTLEILSEPKEGKDAGFAYVHLSLGTKHYKNPKGVAFRDRERLCLFVYPDFPFSAPSLHFSHKRFIGTPHVQWGHSICLYQSIEVEWNPSDGLFGFFERVDKWFSAAGCGQLDPDEAPLHPPIAYTSSETTFVIKADAPLGSAGKDIWLGRAELRKERNCLFDLIGWTEISNWNVTERVGSHIGAAIILSQPLPMEYPSKLKQLFDVLEESGLPFTLIFQLLKLFALMAEEGDPAYFVLGTPMRRKAAGEELKQHLTVWEITADALRNLRSLALNQDSNENALTAVAEWMVNSSVQWCKVLEDRPEIVLRRDAGSLSSTLRGKKVLLFGCGALGVAIAECIVRAGAESLALVDNGIVKPGILVRQHFSRSDIGRSKALALKIRLESIGFPCKLTEHDINLKRSALANFNLLDWDLVIDATASTGVSHKIENEVVDGNLPVTLLSISVSAAAQYGAVSVKMPDYRGGPIQISRQAKLEAFKKHASEAVVKAFWPKQEDIKIFQPEPGCSDPTFIGSAADIVYHASALLNIGLSRIESLDIHKASFDLISAPWLSQEVRKPSRIEYEFEQYHTYNEQNRNYQVLQSSVANREIIGEIKRNSRINSDIIETGGLMFGEIDEGHQSIWIDSVSGPPPGSESTPKKFLCGTSGTVEMANFKKLQSGGSSKFIGIWHTHPVSLGEPSSDDLIAMAQLLLLQPLPPRQVVMLIVGYAKTNPKFNYYLFNRNDFQLIRIPAQ